MHTKNILFKFHLLYCYLSGGIFWISLSQYFLWELIDVDFDNAEIVVCFLSFRFSIKLLHRTTIVIRAVFTHWCKWPHQDSAMTSVLLCTFGVLKSKNSHKTLPIKSGTESKTKFSIKNHTVICAQFNFIDRKWWFYQHVARISNLK